MRQTWQQYEYSYTELSRQEWELMHSVHELTLIGTSEGGSTYQLADTGVMVADSDGAYMLIERTQHDPATCRTCIELTPLSSWSHLDRLALQSHLAGK